MAVSACRPPVRRSRSLLWIILSVALFLVYTQTVVQEGWTGAATLALGFQLSCWGGGLLVAAQRSSSRQLRVSDPLLLVLLWSFLYLILPSIMWVHGAVLPFDQYITDDAWLYLEWMHGLFILGFLAGYLWIQPPRHFQPNVMLAPLPSGKWLFWLPVIPLFITVFIRVASGGGLLPDTSYGKAWFEGQAAVQMARAQGGIAYFLAQLYSKFWFYPILSHSIGLGLIMSRWLLKGRGLPFVLAFAGITVLAHLLLEESGRSGAIIIALIAIIIVDLLIYPIRFSYVAVALVVGLFVFDLLGVVRQVPYSELLSFLPRAIEEYFSPKAVKMGEFSSMLSKEALMLQLVQGWDNPQPLHLLQNILSVIPSQINPLKVNWLPTNDLLSCEMLGEAYYDGAGVAGSIVADGYRIAGAFGVLLLGVLLGLLIGAGHRWAMGEHGLSQTADLLRLCLWAGFLGWTFNIVRADLGSILMILFYYVHLPYVTVRLLPRGTVSNCWCL